MTYPVRSHGRETAVTTNHEKSAEVIVPKGKDRTTKPCEANVCHKGNLTEETGET